MCFVSFPPSSTIKLWGWAKQGQNGKRQKTRGWEGTWRGVAAALKRRGPKSTAQGDSFSSFLFPLPSSTLFLGLFSFLEQNPDSVPCTYKRIITSVSLGETGPVAAGRSLMWMQMELSACVHETLTALEFNQRLDISLTKTFPRTLLYLGSEKGFKTNHFTNLPSSVLCQRKKNDRMLPMRREGVFVFRVVQNLAPGLTQGRGPGDMVVCSLCCAQRDTESTREPAGLVRQCFHTYFHFMFFWGVLLPSGHWAGPLNPRRGRRQGTQHSICSNVNTRCSVFS